MAKDFAGYLVEKRGWSRTVQSALEDTCRNQHVSVFQFLLSNGNSPPYNITEDDVIELVTEFFEVNTTPLELIEEIGGLKYDPYPYTHLGGLNERLAKILIPLKDSDGNRFAVTLAVDDADFTRKISNSYGNEPFMLAVARMSTWNAMHRIFMKPQLFALLAGQVGAADAGSRVRATIKNDSDAQRLFRMLITAGHDHGASDIHMIPCKNNCRVMMRIDGVYRHYTDIPLSSSDRIYQIIENQAKIAAHKTEDPVDGQFRFEFGAERGGKTYRDLRLSSLPVVVGDGLDDAHRDYNLRYLSDRIYTLAEIGMTKEHQQTYRDLLKRPGGMIIVTGPTGSGKSTLLYAGMGIIRDTDSNVISIEDPVESHLDGITQVDIKKGSSLTYAAALKACLRHDPDMVVIGEMRDTEVAGDCTRAANTGILVLSTLHTNDSLGVIERLLNLGINHYSLGEVLVAIISQRLVRRLCPHCRKPYELDLRSTIARTFHFPNSAKQLTFYKPCGCEHCENIGYKGRIAINEILEIDSSMRGLIQKRGIRSNFEDYLRGINHKTLFLDGIEKARQGITSLEELEPIAKDTVSFKC